MVLDAMSQKPSLKFPAACRGRAEVEGAYRFLHNEHVTFSAILGPHSEATIERIRRTPGIERRSVNDEWSAVQTMRHLVFVHDSWFRRCCLGSTELFTPMGIGPTVEPYRGAHGLDLSLDPVLEEIVSVRDAQAAELEAWLDEVTAVQLAARAPVPDDDVWPPYARGRLVRQCLRTVLKETFEHHGFCVRDLDLIEAQDAG